LSALLLWARRHRWAVLVAAAIVAAVSLPIALRIRLESDILQLLPQRGPAIQTFKTYLDHFGSLDRLYLVFETTDASSDITEHEAFIDAFVSRLRSAPEIRSIDAGAIDERKDWSYLFDHELLLLGPEGAKAALARFEPAAMRDALARTRDRLSASSADIKRLAQEDPLGLLTLLRDRLAGDGTLPAVTPAVAGYLSRDRRSRLVIARPVRPQYDTAFSQQLFGRVAEVDRAVRAERREGGAIDADSDAAVHLQTAGGYRIALESERIIRTEAIGQSAGSLVLILVFVFAVFRSPWVLVCGTVPLAMGALLTVAAHAATGDPLSAAATGFTAMLFGLGIDGILLLYLRYLEEQRTGVPDEEATARLAPTARSMVLGNLTTAATFFALVLLDFPSLEQMGRLVGLSILLSCAAALLLLPPLFAIGPRVKTKRALTTYWLATFVEHRARLILVATVAITLALGLASLKLRVATGIDKLQPRTEGSAILEQVMERFGLAQDVVIAMAEGGNLDELLQVHERFAANAARDLPNVAISSPHVLLPSQSAQEATAQVIMQQAPSPDEAAARLTAAARDAGFQPGSFDPFIRRLKRLLDPSTRLTLEGFHEHGLGDIIERFVVRGGPGYLTVSYIPAPPREAVERLGNIAAEAGSGLRLTGGHLVNEELAATFLPQFALGVGLGTAAVAVLIFVVFRRVVDTLLALLPTALGLVWSAGLLATFGVELDLFSFFAVMTFLGIGVDYGIHLLHRCAVEPQAPGDAGRGTFRDALALTGPAILLAGGATVISYATLAGSSYGPLRSLAIMSIVTTATCVSATLLVLPAILVIRRR